ncbi:hypothetical protein [Terrisporobacter sp.]|uniref:hypothetical protein n=1 Tax=Terrisporobacter sp. TaxID=1965305 RepID=UPI0028969069|nr:hypothetical protein [Terrisporobacter sp.]
MQFMIKDAADLVLTPLVGEGGAITIDYLNTFNMKTESEKLAAKAKGVDKIVIYGAKTCSFELGSEVITKEEMAMLLGGELSGTKITVKDTVSAPYYSLAGTFTLKYEDGSEEVQTLKAPKICAQPNADFAMDATNIGTYTLTVDVLAGAEGVLFEIDKKTTV